LTFGFGVGVQKTQVEIVDGENLPAGNPVALINVSSQEKTRLYLSVFIVVSKLCRKFSRAKEETVDTPHKTFEITLIANRDVGTFNVRAGFTIADEDRQLLAGERYSSCAGVSCYSRGRIATLTPRGRDSPLPG
jgi:hypothetical protein